MSSSPSAFADTGVADAGSPFQLEPTLPLQLDSHGNIVDAGSGTTSDPNPGNDVNDPAGDDFNDVFNGADHATRSVFLGRAANAAEPLFTGGGSKDGNDFSGPNCPTVAACWQWTTTGGVQDKDDIDHAYAAKYDGTANRDALLYFGLDRFATSGDATLGFWFLKSKVQPIAGGTFSGMHQDGDLLVQIDYTTGGSQPVVAVRHWSAASAALVTDVTSNSALCGRATGQTFCASTNIHNVVAAWTVNQKSGSGTTNTMLPRTFFKGGVNLKSFGADNACFSTFVAETRSSQDFNSTLSDFMVGSLPSCSASETTTPSASLVSPGTAVTDTADIAGRGVTTPPFPSSSSTAPGTGNQVQFYLCGPTATSSTTTCSSTSNPISSGPLSPTGTQGVSAATSAAVNTAAHPLMPGRYCWLATWAGDSNYTTPITAESNAADECFVVRTIPTATVTTPSDSSGAALSGAQPLGTTIYDFARVTASSAGGGPLAGDVQFYLCDPTQVSGGVCPVGKGTAVGDPVVTPVPSTDPAQATALSNGVPADLAGTWCFRAKFTPTGSTYTGSGDGTSGECVPVNPAPTSTTTTPTLTSNGQAVSVTSYLPVGSRVHDHALVSSSNPAAGPPTGTVHFYVCDPSHLDANNLCSTGGTDLGTVSVTPQPDKSSTADSPDVPANVVGRWCFRGVYSGDANYTGSSDSTAGECFTVKDTTTATSAQRWLPNDHAVITSTDPGTTVSGTISIALHESNDCSGSAVPNQTYTSGDLTGTHSISFDTSNTSYLVSSSKSVSWLVTFTSDNENLVGSSTHCEHTDLTVAN